MKFGALFICLSIAAAQDIHLPPGLERLADKASEVVDVTLDASMLQLAVRFLPDKDPDSARVKRLVNGLSGIYVRSFEFEKPGEYSASDVEALRSQARTPGWSRIAGVRSRKKGENAEVFIKSEGGKISGLMILAAEPKQLTFVSISGFIRPEDLPELGGHFGIPKMEQDSKSGREDN